MKTVVMIRICAILLFIVLILGCGNNSSDKGSGSKEDLVAKQMLQGIWINDDDESVVFKVKGDSIYYPDSTSKAVSFRIVRDTLIMIGAREIKYPIIKQAPHLFVFKNKTGDEVTLTLSDDKFAEYLFQNRKALVVNQGRVVKHDTIVSMGSMRYHCYVQVNPTTYKVLKSTYNDDGVEVDNVYYDNIINFAVYSGANKLFSKNFRKEYFQKDLPKDFIKSAVLNDFIFKRVTQDGVEYSAVIAVPDTPSSYQITVSVSTLGKLSIKMD